MTGEIRPQDGRLGRCYKEQGTSQCIMTRTDTYSMLLSDKSKLRMCVGKCKEKSLKG